MTSFSFIKILHFLISRYNSHLSGLCVLMCIPCGYHSQLDVFRKLLLIRAWCPDRTLSQARKYIFDSLGAEYLESSVLDLESMLDESDTRIPLVCLLSTGSDPSPQIENIAKVRCQELRQLSMGQGQEEAARKLLTVSL